MSGPQTGRIDVDKLNAATAHQRRMQPHKTVDDIYADTNEWRAEAQRFVELHTANKTTTTDGITFVIKPGPTPTVESATATDPDALPTDPEKLAAVVLKAWCNAKESTIPPGIVEQLKRLGVQLPA